MQRRSVTAEDKMNSAFWGCLGLAAIVVVILAGGGVLIFRALT